MADTVYQVDVDTKPAIDGLRDLDKKFTDTGKKANGVFVDQQGRLRNLKGQYVSMGSAAGQAFGVTGKSAQLSGVQIGAIAGIVSSLTTAFINLGQQAVGALIEIGKQSVQTAIEVDTLKARLGGIFDGSKEAADEAFDFIQSRSVALGIDLKELAGAFLPKVESLKQFEEVAKIATALARSDPEQGAIGARIALIEALSGSFASLSKRFEIPKDDIALLKEAFDEKGIQGFLDTFNEVLDKSGKGFDDLANTAQTSFNRISEAGTQLGGIVGGPIVDALAGAADEFLSFLGTLEDGVFTFNDDIVVFADTIGRAIADVIDFIASVDLGELDTQQLIEFADYIFRIVNAVQLVVGQFTGWIGAVSQTIDAVTPLGEALDYLWYLFTNIDDALVTLSQILAISKAGYEGLYAGIQPLLPLLEALFNALDKAGSKDFLGAAAAIGDAVEALKTATFDQAAAQEAIDASLAESAQAMADYQAAVDGNKDSQEELRDSLQESAAAGTDAADGILAAAQAEREAAAAADELKAAQDKVNEAMAEAEKDFQRKLEDIDINAERKRLDILLDFAQKREDAARDHLQKLEDIRRHYAQEVDDAATELSRREEDIARQAGEDRIDLEREQRQKVVDIEADFRRQLEDIQNQFLLDAEEAEQKRDAVGFLRALKERDKKVQEAQKNRQQSIDDARLEGERRREELRIQQERELEESRLANERKLEDLRLNLERQIEAQNIAYEQQLEDLRLNEERKLEEANTARERDIEDAKRAYERKLEDLRASLAEELAIIQAAHAEQEAEAARHAEAMESAQRESSTYNPAYADAEVPAGRSHGPPRRGPRPSVGRRRFQSGGEFTVPPGYPNDSYPIGVSSGERVSVEAKNAGAQGSVSAGYQRRFVSNMDSLLQAAQQSGAPLPASEVLMNTGAAGGGVAAIDNSQNATVNIPMVDASGLANNPILVRQIRNIARNEIAQVL